MPDVTTAIVAMPAADPTSGGTVAAQVAGALTALGNGATLVKGGSAPDVTSDSTVSGTSSAAAVQSSSTASPSGPREMVIQLDPEHLGTVSIKMRMAGGKLQIDIRVGNAEALDVLSRDRHILSAAVEAVGGSQDNVLLGTAVDQTPTPGDQGSGPTGSGAQAGAGQQQAFSSAPSSNGGGGGQRPANDPTASDTMRDDDDALPTNLGQRGLDGSLYV